MLILGSVLMAAGTVGVDIGAQHVGAGTDPWPLVPGLFVAGFGLSLLVIPLANVVLAAVPANIAGGASGIFSTIQQMGGAIGIATIGTVFFAGIPAHGFRAAFTHVAPIVAAVFLAAALLAVMLPKTAVEDAEAA